MKTREEVEALKMNWLKDPIYDLASVEGFEEYHSELDQFQDEQEAKWKAEREEKVKQSFDYRATDIKAKLEMDPIWGAMNSELAQITVARQQVLAILLLAEQVERVASALEDGVSYDQYIRGN